MTSDQRFDMRVTCAYCGHASTISVAAVSLPGDHRVNCPVCGTSMGTIAQIKVEQGLDWHSRDRLAS